MSKTRDFTVGVKLQRKIFKDKKLRMKNLARYVFNLTTLGQDCIFVRSQKQLYLFW
jgi:hypothetical protein